VLATRGIRRASKEIQIGDLLFNVDTLIVSRHEHEIDLNPIGLKLLRCLMEASPNVVTRTEIQTRHGIGYRLVESNAVQT